MEPSRVEPIEYLERTLDLPEVCADRPKRQAMAVIGGRLSDVLIDVNLVRRLVPRPFTIEMIDSDMPAAIKCGWQVQDFNEAASLSQSAVAQ